MAARFDAERQDGCSEPLDLAAPGTPPRSRGCTAAVQPFSNTTRKGPSLRLWSGQPSIELGNGGALVKERLPILGGPLGAPRPQQRNNVGLVTREFIKQGGRRRGRRLQD